MEENTVSLSALVAKICDSWGKVEAKYKKGIEVESFTVSLTVSRTTSVSGEIRVSLFILTGWLRGSLEKNRFSTITVELTTEKAALRKGRNPGKGEAELTEFFTSILKDFKKLSDGGLISNLKKRTLTIQAGLTISKELRGGLEFSIKVFTVAGEFSAKVEQGHTFELVLVEKEE